MLIALYIFVNILCVTTSRSASTDDRMTGTPTSPSELTEMISETLTRYGAWSTRREALSAAEDALDGGRVTANEWNTSDDEAVELAHSMAALLAEATAGQLAEGS